MACNGGLLAFLILTFIFWSGVSATAQAAKIPHSCTHEAETFYYLCPASIEDAHGNVHSPPVRACGPVGLGSYRNSTVCLTNAGEVPGRGESCSCDHPNGCYNPCDPSNGPGNTGNGNTGDGDTGNGNTEDGNTGRGDNNNGGRGNGSKATVPTAPRGLTVTAGNQEASLKWSPPSDDGGTPVIGYEYQQRVEGEGFGKTWLKVDGGGDIRGVTSTGLENGITYFFRVRAVNKVDEGKPSNEARATPLAPLVTLAVVRSSVAEGEDAVFVLRRTDEIKTALDVNIRVDESGDILVDGYQAPTLVTFPAGELEYRLSIATVDDAVDEAEGTVTVTLVKDAGYELGSPDTVTIAVRDNDDAPELAVADAQAIEDAGVMVFSVRLNAPSSLTITVDYATSDGTAAAGADYSAANGSLLFMPGDVEQTVSVLLQADEVYETDETFVLTLSNPVNAELADAAATGTVISGDGNTEDGISGDGNTEDGNTEDGNTEDGNTEDGISGDGNTEDGNTEDGTASVGTATVGTATAGTATPGTATPGRQHRGRQHRQHRGRQHRDGNTGDGNTGNGNTGTATPGRQHRGRQHR